MVQLRLKDACRTCWRETGACVRPHVAGYPTPLTQPPTHPPLGLTQNTDIGEVAWMFWILLLLLLVSRVAIVVPVTLAHNRYSDSKLTMREMATIWWAGLMRGAVSGEAAATTSG